MTSGSPTLTKIVRFWNSTAQAMHIPDFLHTSVDTPLCENFIAAGAVCRLSTNSHQLLEAARVTFLPAESHLDSVNFSMRFWVDDADHSEPPWPKPYVRGLDHLVFIGLDWQSSILANLHTRRVIGRISVTVANDASYWKTIVFPMLLSIMAGSIGLVELHASCVARDRKGLILVGPSRSGKSTLALALGDEGFALLSDDRIFCSLGRRGLLAWGLPRPLKLRCEAARWFDDFRDQEPTDVQNGEPVFRCESRHARVPNCEPQLIIFLERRKDPGFFVAGMKRGEAKSRIEGELLAEGPAAIRKQRKSLDQLLSLPCCILRFGGSPQMVAQKLSATF